MEQNRFAVVPRALNRLPSRREALRGLAGTGVALGTAWLPTDSDAKKRKPKHRNGLCQRNGSPCKKPGKSCQKRYCLRAPFTIEIIRQSDPVPHIYLFVPPKDGATGPSPWIAYACPQTTSTCETAYPFACVDLGINGSGNGITTTIHQLLSGRYEYWVWLEEEIAAGELTIILRGRGGRFVRDWANPANATTDVGWHVFDVDATGRVTSIDALPVGFPDPSTNVCPSIG
jgi:hypothetical protein